MKGYEIDRVLDVDPSTVGRDIQYLTLQSQIYLDMIIFRKEANERLK
jgi:hypothetical protein